jgi:hypothetical protein
MAWHILYSLFVLYADKFLLQFDSCRDD